MTLWSYLDPCFLPKVCSRFHVLKELVLPFFPSPSSTAEQLYTWDMKRALSISVDRSAAFRSPDALCDFWSSWLGEGFFSPDHWLVDQVCYCFGLSGLWFALSCWCAGPFHKGCLRFLCRAGTWPSDSTFTRHYRVNCALNERVNYGSGVLRAVEPAAPS